MARFLPFASSHTGLKSLLAAALFGALSAGVGIGCMFDLPDVRQGDGPWQEPDAGDDASTGGYPPWLRDGALDAPDAAKQDAPLCTPECQGKCHGEPDGCGGVCPTDQCAPGEVCSTRGLCCLPDSCQTHGYQCGKMPDGCGHEISCGTCSDPSYCFDHKCKRLELEFVSIPAGTFYQGSPTTEPGRDLFDSYSLDETLHRVQLTHPFLISRTEVTQGTFRIVMGYNPSLFSDCGPFCPVEMVSWDETAAFMNRLSEAKDLPPCFVCSGSGKEVSCHLDPAYSTPYDCKGFRMPTEAEWEYAARAKTSGALYTGNLTYTGCDPVDPNLSKIAWYFATSKSNISTARPLKCDGSTVRLAPHAVGLKAPNSFGLMDMAGNVWEWTMDCPASYPNSSVVDPYSGASCSNEMHVFRGGGFGNHAAQCRHAERAARPGYTPTRGHDVGIRVVRTGP